MTVIRKYTWFGFSMTQKQAVWIFVLSLIGICILSFALFSIFFSLFANLIYLDPYYFPPNYYLRQLLIMLPYLVFIVILLILAIYTAVKCRRIAIFHSRNEYHNKSHDIKMERTNFCPNCGQNRSKNANFCTNCGFQWQ